MSEFRPAEPELGTAQPQLVLRLWLGWSNSDHFKTIIISFLFSDQSLKFGPNSGHFIQMSLILILTRVFEPIGSPAEQAV